jgi:hypothetical protein
MELTVGRTYVFRSDIGLFVGLFDGWNAGKLVFENATKIVETTELDKLRVDALRIVDIEEWHLQIKLDASPSLRAMSETAEELAGEVRYCVDRAKPADIANW